MREAIERVIAEWERDLETLGHFKEIDILTQVQHETLETCKNKLKAVIAVENHSPGPSGPSSQNDTAQQVREQTGEALP